MGAGAFSVRRTVARQQMSRHEHLVSSAHLFFGGILDSHNCQKGGAPLCRRRHRTRVGQRMFVCVLE